MGGVAAYGNNFGTNLVALVVEIHVTTALTIHLDGSAGCALRLVTDEEYVVSRVMEHGFEIIDYSTAAAHTVPGNDNGRTSGLHQVSNHRHVYLR
jgi:hypothetical protein